MLREMHYTNHEYDWLVAGPDDLADLPPGLAAYLVDATSFPVHAFTYVVQDITDPANPRIPLEPLES